MVRHHAGLTSVGSSNYCHGDILTCQRHRPRRPDEMSQSVIRPNRHGSLYVSMELNV